MQPYQKAERALRESGEYPINLAKNIGLGIASGAAAKFGSSAISTILPKIKALINEYVPDDISMKGLEKVDPRFKEFIKGALDAGYDYTDIRNSIGERIEKSEQNHVRQNKNLIEQESPELHQFILSEIQKGRSHLQAGALAQLEDKKGFSKIIKKLEKSHHAPWSSILETIYGGQQQAISPIEEEKQQPQQMQQQGQQPGQGSAALMKILQKIQQARGG